MKLTNKAMIYFTAMAAAASFLNTAPVMAAEQTKIENRGPEMAETRPQLGLAGYEINDTGVMVKSGLVEVQGDVYCLDAFGQKVKGLTEVDGTEYYFTQEGYMKKGWVHNDGKWYFLNRETGERETGVIEDEGNTYVLNEDGSFVTGWNEGESGWNYYDEEGVMVQDESMAISGVNYDFDAQGNWIQPANVETPAQAEEAQAAPVGDDSRYQMIANAAIAQIGVTQDCTMLVTNSLRAVGINFHGAPYKYLSLGPTTNNPVPGDIIVYQGHVAIYIGNGRAIHGGWNGHTTVEWSVNCSTPFVAYVHPILP